MRINDTFNPFISEYFTLPNHFRCLAHFSPSDFKPDTFHIQAEFAVFSALAIRPKLYRAFLIPGNSLLIFGYFMKVEIYVSEITEAYLVIRYDSTIGTDYKYIRSTYEHLTQNAV